MFRKLLFIFSIFSYCTTQAQIHPVLINSADIIQKAYKLSNDGKYEEAAALYDGISRNDTNYIISRYEEAACFYNLGKFDTVMRICKELNNIDDYSGIDAYILMGNALDEKDKTEEAIAMYKNVLAKFPLSFLCNFNLGVAYYKHKDYDLAYKSFQRSLELNPLHPASNYFLGVLMADNKRWAPAMLAMETALLLNPSKTLENKALNGLINIAKGEFIPDNPNPSFTEPEDKDFAKMDKLIESKVALRAEYKIANKMDDKLMKQTQFLLESMKQTTPKSDNYFVKRYVALYLDILQQPWFKSFLYYPYKDVDNDLVTKWKSHNKKEIEDMEAWIAQRFSKEAMEYTDTVNGHAQKAKRYFYNSGALDAIGTDYDEKTKVHKGHWKSYFANTRLHSEGDYDNSGRLQGDWKVFYNNGQTSVTAHYVDDKVEGALKSYYDNGNPKKTGTYKGGLYSGKVTEYYANGNLQTEATYTAGVGNGHYVSYYSNGNPEVTGEIKDDHLLGYIYRYAEPGYMTSKAELKDGSRNGKYESYYSNGQVNEKGQYVQGLPEGQWKFYDDAGHLVKECQYLKGELTGAFKQYYANGKTESIENYDTKGKATGLFTYFDDDGIKYFDGDYRDGHLVSYKYFDKAGKVLSSASEAHGELTMKAYRPDGYLSHEGLLKKGLREGDWTYYYRNGAPSTKEHFDNDKLNGVLKEYYKNGNLHKEITYVNNIEQGYFAIYSENGKLDEEGNLANGNKEGDVYNYYTDGTMSWHSYYNQGEETGWQSNYNPGGKLTLEYLMHNGYLTRYSVYDTSGKPCSTFYNPTATADLKVSYFNQKPQRTAHYEKGNLAGPFVNYYGNGETKSQGSYVKGYQSGLYKEFSVDGTPSKTGFYKYGKADSVWTFYDEHGIVDARGPYKLGERHGYWQWLYANGKPQFAVNYIDGDRDSIATLYAPDGKVRVKLKFDSGVLKAYTYEGKDGKDLPFIDLPAETGKVLAYYSNGNKSYECNYVNGGKDGKLLAYYSDGKIQWEENYTKNMQHGKQVYYYPDGKIEREEMQVDDEFSGPVKYYDTKGNPVLEQTYYMNILHGPYRQFENGKLKKEVNYYYGVLMP